ncbi:peptide chain release factor N(5)-glutamine methyltransferase [Acetobacteraceae bacterium KSS8]|uniref:Release factor glutamine methyltransferase n=1 Tax=Endosaccharibacter trunci TaxID=2812733 RepID=A0ABT1W4P7_9PROT|nr:peptide chain release factor N(5)-glutamine methyltransferase [Acetobacteraceae bacterium KSS8]
MTRISIGRLLAEATQRLDAAGIEQPGREARLLLAQALGTDMAGLIRLGREALAESDRFEALLARRCQREPMAFLLGSCGFWSLDLAVSEETLIPRADSEAVIEAVLAAIPDRSRPLRVLDFGTGTGCLLLAVLSEYPAATGFGIDLSPGAAALARRNAASNGLGERAAFLCGSWDAAIDMTADLVLSNPPYIPEADLPSLMPEVRLFEPARALDGGGDGLTAYRALVPALHRLLAPNGLAVFEFGIGQAPAIASLATEAGLDVRAVRADLGGVDRAITLGWREKA